LGLRWSSRVWTIQKRWPGWWMIAQDEGGNLGWVAGPLGASGAGAGQPLAGTGPFVAQLIESGARDAHCDSGFHGGQGAVVEGLAVTMQWGIVARASRPPPSLQNSLFIPSHPENQLVKQMRLMASMGNGRGRDARATVRALPVYGHGLEDLIDEMLRVVLCRMFFTPPGCIPGGICPPKPL
jgi:hypothetical protein